MKKAKDYTGFRNGRIVAVKPTSERSNHKVVWLCQCDCGNESYVTTNNLRATRSCGCLRAEKLSENQRKYRWAK